MFSYFEEIVARDSSDYFFVNLAKSEDAVSALVALKIEVFNLISSNLDQDRLMRTLQWWGAQIQESYCGRGQHPICRGLSQAFQDSDADQLLSYLTDFILAATENHFAIDFKTEKDFSDYCYRFGGSFACSFELVENKKLDERGEIEIKKLGSEIFKTMIFQDFAVYLDKGVNPIALELRKNIENGIFRHRINDREVRDLINSQLRSIQKKLEKLRSNCAPLEFSRIYSIKLIKEMINSNILSQRIDLGVMRKYLIFLRALWF